jgi:predicted PurR-regulated permease PerM
MGGWKFFLWASVVLLAIWFLYLVRSILLPFVLAFLISALLDPTIKKLRLRGVSRPAAVWLVSILFFFVLVLVGIWVTPKANSQIGLLRDRFEAVTQSLAADDPSDNVYLNWNPVNRVKPSSRYAMVDRLLDEARPMLERLGLPTSRQGLVQQFVEPHRKEFAKITQNFFNSLFGIVTAVASHAILLLFTPLFVIYMLLDLERIKARSAAWIPASFRRQTVSMLQEIGQVFISYLRGVTIYVALYSVTGAIVLSILGAPYFILLAILGGVLALIPNFGAILTYFILFLTIGLNGQSSNWFLSMSSPWMLAIVIVAIFAIFSTLFDQLVYPNLVGRGVGLHPVISFFVLFSAATLFGLAGMLVAFPIAGSIKVILEKVLKYTTSSDLETLNLPAVPLRHRAASDLSIA